MVPDFTVLLTCFQPQLGWLYTTFAMSNLRSKIIKLAHQNPELRKDLLPLLKRASGRYADPAYKSEVASSFGFFDDSISVALGEYKSVVASPKDESERNRAALYVDILSKMKSQAKQIEFLLQRLAEN